MGDNYAGIKLENVINPFWKDVLKSWKLFCKSVQVETLEDILYSPVWFNSNFLHGQNFYIKDWYDKGIRNVMDLLNTEGQFYQYHQLREKYQIQGTYLNYLALMKKLPAEWKHKINENSIICQDLKQNTAQNCYVKYLCKDKKGSRTFYDFIIGNKIPTLPLQKWMHLLGNITQEEWDSYNGLISNTAEIKLKEFQFKINNHILVTKSFLYKIKKVENDRCSFCNQHSETILHLFYYCNKVKEFWSDLQKWLETKADITLYVTVKSVIFSKQSQNDLINYILLLAKYYIYRTKFFTNLVRIETFIPYLRKKFQNEMYISKLHNKLDKFLAKWSALGPALRSETNCD